MTILNMPRNCPVVFDDVAPVGFGRFEPRQGTPLDDAGALRSRIESIANAKASLIVQESLTIRGRSLTGPRGRISRAPLPGRQPRAARRRLAKNLPQRWLEFVGATCICAHLRPARKLGDHLLSYAELNRKTSRALKAPGRA
jgi:hypothetical protein